MSAGDIIGVLSFALQATHTLYTAIQLIQDAPDEMEALQVEVNRVKGILVRSIELSENRPGGINQSPDVLRLHRDLIEQARKWTEAAKRFVEKATKVKGDGTRKVNRAMWPFKSSDAKKLAEESKAFYAAVAACYSMDVSTRISLLELNAHATERMSERITRLEELLSDERVVQLLTRSLLIVSHQQRQCHHQHFDELDFSHNSSEIAHGIPAQHLSLAGSYLAPPASPYHEPGPSTMATEYRSQSTSTSRTSASSDVTYLYHQSPSHPSPLRPHCSSGCQCCCHKQPGNYRLIPSAFRSWFGDLRIPKALIISLASAMRACDDAECVRSMKSMSTVKWYLPQLFAQVHAVIKFQSLPVQFLIQTPRAVKSFDLIPKLSFEDLKVKLSTGEFTVNDVRADGLPLLHFVALMVVHECPQALDTIHHLIDAGAPQDWEYDGRTVTEYVTDMRTLWFGDTPTGISSLQLFQHCIAKPLLHEDLEDTWEGIRAKRNWSNLHYLLANPPSSLAQLRKDLATVLRQSNSTLHLNSGDFYGRIPLEQAIVSCPRAVDTLLRAGADPGLVSEGLGYAVKAYSWRAIGPLVRVGVDVNKRSCWSNGAISTALHDIVRVQSALGPGSGLRCALELVRHAGHLLDWDVEDECRKNPLRWAERRMKKNPNDQDVASIYKLYKTRRLPLGLQLSRISCLDEDAEIVVQLKSTSLVKEGIKGNAQAVGKLIDAGAMVNERDPSGRTLLHLVAMGVVPNGYTVALALVRHGGYSIDWDASTVDGETAQELAEERHEYLSASRDKEKHDAEDEGDDQDEDDGEERETEVGAEGNSNSDDDAKNISYRDNCGVYKKAVKTLRLLQRRVLPTGVSYIYPCIHSDYCRACSGRPCSGYCNEGLRMPGEFSHI